ncbi:MULTISPECIES: hypothetical protein [Streptomyces]|uniref:hypothetical protein n=1 Tax=Streptomyces TaxID=1883 RepID=UPI0027833DF7|nr:hypothetical protein [Streptomyces achromogenes]MDQ0833775.1 purine-cytosine permease-like protein [Streptomyces achromogenes]
MASRASSKASAQETPVLIPALPKLGTTWYKRGTLYWLCRARTTVFLLVVMAMVCFFALNLYRGFTSEWTPPARTVANWVQAAASCVALPWGWLKQRRGHREALLNPPTPEQTRLAKSDHNRRAPGRIAAGRGLVLLAAPVLPAFAAYIVGWLTAWLTVREYPSEVGARRWLEKHGSRP